jgi:D-methionine transport system substrate-binding protein
MKRCFYFTILIFASLVLILTGCRGSPKPVLKVAATSVPHAEILEFMKPILEAKNVEIEIIIIDDFNTPNRALTDQEVDANFFQHFPFLEAQIADFGYKLESLVGVHLEPMALYSKKFHSIDELKEGAAIALPSDPSNQARALELCEKAGLIALRSKGAKTSILDIASNPLHLHFVEMDSPLLSRALDDVDAAAISTNFALLGGLSPKKDALAIEDAQSRYVNLVAIRKGESERADLQVLKETFTTEQVRQYIERKYKEAVIPAF